MTGKELHRLEGYASARRTTFNAFYTSPPVTSALHAALIRLTGLQERFGGYYDTTAVAD